MAEEKPKLSEITLDTDALPKALQEKFAGKSVEDVLASYEEAQNKITEQGQKITELETKPPDPEPEPEPEPDPDPDPDPDETYDDLYGDDTYVTKESVDKRLAAIEKKNAENLKAVEERATANAMAQIERKAFIDNHPEIFDGKSPQEADAVIKRVAGAGFVAGKQSLEGGLEAIREMAGELGMTENLNSPERDVPSDLKAVGEYDSPDDEIKHMKEYHKQHRGTISSHLK